MKRFLCLLISIVLVLSVLAGCGTAKDTATETTTAVEPAAETTAEPVAEPAKPVTLKIITWSNPATIDNFKALNEKLKAKYPHITVDMTDAPGGAEFDTLCETRIAAKDADNWQAEGRSKSC